MPKKHLNRDVMCALNAHKHPPSEWIVTKSSNKYTIRCSKCSAVLIELYNTLGKNLNNARREAGLTQQELAQASGVSRASICAIESNEVDPRIGTIRCLAITLNIHMKDLLPE